MKKLLAIASGLAIAVGMLGCDEKTESSKSVQGPGGGMNPAPAMNAPGAPGGDPGGMPGGVDPGGMPGAPGLADAGMPGAGLPDAGMPGAGLPDAGMPGAEVPGGIGPGMPGVVDAGMPGADMPGGIGPGMPGAVDAGMPGMPGVADAGMPGMPGVPGIGVGDAGMPGMPGVGEAGMPGMPGLGLGDAGMPGVPGGPGGPGAGRPKTDYPAGSAEAAVVKLVLDLKAGKYKEMAKVISAKTSNPLLKSLRSGRPNASDVSKANSYMGQVKPAGEGGARKLSSTEHQFTLVNQRGLLLTFVCRQEGGKFMIYSLKTRASRSRRRR